MGFTYYTVINNENNSESEGVLTFDTSLGIGTPQLSASTGLILLPNVVSKEELAGAVISVGGSASALGKASWDLILNTDGIPIGIKASLGVTPFPVPGDGHITYDYSRIISSTPLKIPVKAVELSNKILEEYKKDPNNPILLKLGEELYQEIERTNK